MSAPTPLEQIDLLLTAWDERLRRMDENLVALESEAIYQILAGKAGKRVSLEGTTKAAVGPALDAVSELFENRERLANVVAKAKDVRVHISTIAFWEKDEKIAEIQRLLRGASVELGQKVVALSNRSLLDESYHDVMVEPEKLLADMATKFQEARTTLLAVSRAWEALDPVIAAIEAEVRELESLAHELGDAGSTELGETEAELTKLRGRVAKDPLGAEGALDLGIRPRLAVLRAKLDAERAAKGRVEGALADARDLRRRLGETHASAGRHLREAEHELAGARLGACVDEGLLAGLDEWLAKLEEKVAARRFPPAEVGIARWRATADQYLANDAAVASAAEALLARRGELSGRLSARRAQASALAARGRTLDPVYDAWAREAEALLQRRPLPLAEALHAVETYESGVVALAAQAARRG